MKKVLEVLENNEGNYILPFFWLHGEEEDVLRDYINKIYESGIKAVCVESRPHPDYVGPKWWSDLDIIMDEARKKDIKVWILDDSHFPTGYAVGKIKNDYPQLQKLYLNIKSQDFVGPQKNARVLVKWATVANAREKVMNVGVEDQQNDHKLERLEEKIVAVVAAKRNSLEKVDPETLIDITESLKDGIVYWDMPEGDWRIFTIVETPNGGEAATEGYLNPIDSEATQVLIDTVYESHYQRYKEYFGTTIAGFFSDESRFGNAKGHFASIGRFDMVLPWRKDMLQILQKRISSKVKSLLPLLWEDAGDLSNQIRYEYMNILTQLYAENFAGKLGTWCRNHGVQYIGHGIEDNNAHARLGYGAGHFYRSLWEQDMAGIDVVLHQILPGMDKGYFKSFTASGWDGEFFHYGLAKMGASLGHLDPKKNGKVMCEMYGAYGWGEGIKLMKWLTDHMLVRGVNYFVPHAFTPRKFPDPDCPPHFYAHGHNPQYRFMSELMRYMNRMSHLLTDGIHIAPVAVLYHGEAEWSGEYMLFQKPARELLQHQIDFDVISGDVLIPSEVKNENLVVHNESFSVLVIPFSEALPQKLIKSILSKLDNGFTIYFIDELPERSSEGVDIKDELIKIRQHKNCGIVPLHQLGNHLINEGLNEINVSGQQSYLRYYHYQQNDGDIFMYFNENPNQSIETTITVPLTTEAYVYDGFANKITPLNTEKLDQSTSFTLLLEKNESKVIIFSDKLDCDLAMNKQITKLKSTREVKGKWKVSLSTAEEYPKFSNCFELEQLRDLASPDLFPNFSGTVRYELDFNIDSLDEMKYLLSIKEAYEATEVWLNNEYLGKKICPPYKYDVSSKLNKGTNHLVIEVTNTLVNQQQDYLSQFLLLEPTGIVGTVELEMY